MLARKWVCVVSCVPMLAGIPAVLIGNPYSSLAFICLALFGYASWSTMGLTLPSDLFPSEVVATITGLTGLAAGLTGTVFTLLVGTLVDHSRTFRPLFWRQRRRFWRHSASCFSSVGNANQMQVRPPARCSKQLEVRACQKFGNGCSRREWLLASAACAVAPKLRGSRSFRFLLSRLLEVPSGLLDHRWLAPLTRNETRSSRS